MITLLIIAMNDQKEAACKGVNIFINNQKTGGVFLTEKDIKAILNKVEGGTIKGTLKKDINLNALEQGLRKNKWVSDVKIFFDGNDNLNVNVLEKAAVARIFTNQGTSFYIDMAGVAIPVSGQMQESLPVFTGFPHSKPVGAKDSVLLQDVVTLAQVISNDSFWTAQAAQIDMVPTCTQGCWEFDMVPTVGNHIIQLGSVADIHAKLRRLFIFYKNVMAKTGFDSYATVDVRFANQVIGRKTKGSSIDSAAYKQYVAAFLKRQSMADSIEAMPARIKAKPDSLQVLTAEMPGNNTSLKPVLSSVKKTTEPGTKKTPIVDNKTNKGKTVVKPITEKKVEEKPVPVTEVSPGVIQPKAVMPKRKN